MLLNGCPLRAPGNTNGLPSSRWTPRNSVIAASESGMRCSLPAFIRLAGIVHTAPCRSISDHVALNRSEEHTSELQSLMRISYAVFCLKKKTQQYHKHNRHKNKKQQKRTTLD